MRLGDGADAPRLARQVDEYAAELAAAHPDRFGFFATLTLPFAPDPAVVCFATWADDAHLDHHSARTLFPRLETTPDA